MIHVSKYHGLGNDFVLLDHQEVIDINHSKLARSLCARNTGIGADGLIIVKDKPLEMIFYNSDGSRAEMCGNGIRCFSKYVYDKGILDQKDYEVLTLAGIMTIHVLSFEPFMVEVNMGKASYHPKDIPLASNYEAINKEFTIGNNTVKASSLLMGVPHTVIKTNSFDKDYLETIGRFFENSSFYPEGTNVNFYQIINRDTVNMQTYERGAGLTLACGTGASACFAHLYKEGLVNQAASLQLPLGELHIREDQHNIYMSGPAEKIFEGHIKKEVFE